MSCLQGQCISDSKAPTGNSNCFFGEGIVTNNAFYSNGLKLPKPQMTCAETLQYMISKNEDYISFCLDTKQDFGSICCDTCESLINFSILSDLYLTFKIIFIIVG